MNRIFHKNLSCFLDVVPKPNAFQGNIWQTALKGLLSKSALQVARKRGAEIVPDWSLARHYIVALYIYFWFYTTCGLI